MCLFADISFIGFPFCLGLKNANRSGFPVAFNLFLWFWIMLLRFFWNCRNLEIALNSFDSLQFAVFFSKMQLFCVVWFSTECCLLVQKCNTENTFFWSFLYHHDNLVVASVGSLWSCLFKNWCFISWFQINAKDFPKLLTCWPRKKIMTQKKTWTYFWKL